jgi:hypothetical protein
VWPRCLVCSSVCAFHQNTRILTNIGGYTEPNAFSISNYKLLTFLPDRSSMSLVFTVARRGSSFVRSDEAVSHRPGLWARTLRLPIHFSTSLRLAQATSPTPRPTNHQ